MHCDHVPGGGGGEGAGVVTWSHPGGRERVL